MGPIKSADYARMLDFDKRLPDFASLRFAGFFLQANYADFTTRGWVAFRGPATTFATSNAIRRRLPTFWRISA